jgi:hypothetical protein
VIVYAAPEGDEVATYTRGTAGLIDGEATVLLGETFRWVTNPDIGLTAHVTPRGDPIPLAVVELSTEQMVVRGPEDAPDGLVFDYLVYGLRIGFEETSVVQEKSREAYIPSMSDHRELYQRRPDLRRYNSLERFKAMRRAVGKSGDLDLSRAHALRDAIVEFDPAVHELPRPAGLEETTLRGFKETDEGIAADVNTGDDGVVTRAPEKGVQLPISQPYSPESRWTTTATCTPPRSGRRRGRWRAWWRCPRLWSRATCWSSTGMTPA